MFETLSETESSLTKQFWLFAGDYYYPGGGFHDFVNSYDTREEAEEEALIVLRDPGYVRKKYDWYHIFDSTVYLFASRSH